MSKHITGGVAAALGLLSCTALVQAADLPPRVAPPVFTAPAVINNWGGFYAGTTYSYGFSQFETRNAGRGASRTKDISGSAGGGLIGYNFQYGHIVFGPEGSIDINDIRGIARAQGGLPARRYDSLYDIRLRGRVGYEFGWFMPFVAGGAVIDETNQSTIPPFSARGDNRQSVGYTVGAGVDVKINPSAYLPINNAFIKDFLGPLIVRVEYLHDELPAENYAYGGRRFRTTISSDTGRVALISRFGDNPPRPYVGPSGEINWNGAYGGVIGGGGFLTATTKRPGTRETKIDADGGIGGLYTGVNFTPFNRIVVGIEGATTYTDIQGNGREPTGPASFRSYVEADTRARVGYAFGSFLPFVAGGVLLSRSEQIDTRSGSERGRIYNAALTAGAGIDYHVTERISVRGEYLYVSSYNNKLVNLNNCANCKQELDGNIVRAGVAYHFE